VVEDRVVADVDPCDPSLTVDLDSPEVPRRSGFEKFQVTSPLSVRHGRSRQSFCPGRGCPGTNRFGGLVDRGRRWSVGSLCQGAPPRLVSYAAVDIRPVRSPVDQHDPLVLQDLVDHAVVTPPCGMEALELAAQGLPGAMRIDRD